MLKKVENFEEKTHRNASVSRISNKQNEIYFGIYLNDL